MLCLYAVLLCFMGILGCFKSYVIRVSLNISSNPTFLFCLLLSHQLNSFYLLSPQSPLPHLTSPCLTSPLLTSLHLISPYLTPPYLSSPHLTLPYLTSPLLTSPHFTSPLSSPPLLTSPHLTSPQTTSKRVFTLKSKRTRSPTNITSELRYARTPS